MSILVNKPGMFTSIQDTGRWGCQSLGVSVTGAMDPSALRLANCVVGNPLNTACLEVTLSGPSLVFEEAACIAVSGAFLNPHIDEQAIQNNCAYIIQAGQTLSFKPSSQCTGARAYIAVHGGFKSELVMGSQSTDYRVGIGGILGRALQKEDRLHLNGYFSAESLELILSHLHKRKIYLSSGLGIQTRKTIRIIRGAHFQHFTMASREALVDAEFAITPQSDRMGYRLQGPALELEQALQLRSEPMAFGTIQVPADGQAIALMADRQSIGGYPKIANIIQTDLSYLAQHLPGQKIQFSLCTVEQAQQLWAERLEKFTQLSQQVQETSVMLKEHFVAY